MIAWTAAIALAGKVVVAPTLATGDVWETVVRTEQPTPEGSEVIGVATERTVTGGGTLYEGHLTWDEHVAWVQGRRRTGSRISEWSSQLGRAPESEWWSLAERLDQRWHAEVDWFGQPTVVVEQVELEDPEAAMARGFYERKAEATVTRETAADVASWPAGTFRRKPVTRRGPAPPETLPERDVVRAWTLVEVTDATLRFDETVTLVPLLGDDPVLAFSGEGSVVVDRASGVPLVQESTWTWQERTSAGAVPHEAHRTVSRQRGTR